MITPFNFPLNLAAHKIGPAIASGCPFVLKPADRTPVSSSILGEILSKTSLPEVLKTPLLFNHPRVLSLFCLAIFLSLKISAKTPTSKCCPSQDLLKLDGN
jgi:hypothetical protein